MSLFDIGMKGFRQAAYEGICEAWDAVSVDVLLNGLKNKH